MPLALPMIWAHGPDQVPLRLSAIDQILPFGCGADNLGLCQHLPFRALLEAP